MASTTTAVTIAEGIRLDLGHTDLVGDLVFDGEDLVLVTPNGTPNKLGSRTFTPLDGQTREAPEGHILIEEMGLHRLLPAALASSGFLREAYRHKDYSSWGPDVVELLVLTAADTESE